MARVPRRNVLRAVCVAAAAAAGGCVSLTAGGVGGRRPGTLIVTNRDDRSRTVDVCAKPAADESIPRTTVRLDGGESRVRDGFVATAGRYVVEVRRGGGEERVLAETTVTYDRTDRGTIRGDVIESGGAVAVSPTG